MTLKIIVKKAATLFAAVAFVATAHAPSASAEDVLRVAMEGAYPPFNWTDSEGTIKGFDADMTYALCERIGRECEIVAQDWDGMIPGLLAKKYDLIIASMSITADRKKKVDFTGKYYQTPARMVARVGANIDVSSEGLADVSAGVQRATTHACYLEKFHGNADIKLYANQEDGYNDLRNGRIDVFVADGIQILEALLNQDGGDQFELVGPVLDDVECLGEGTGIALRKGNEELRDALSQAILDMRADGSYAEVNARTFPMDIYGAE